MSEVNHTVTVTIENFEAEVINRSMEVPVIVDIGSARSPASKTLTANLEKLALEYGGRFVLAKVDADTQMEIAQSFQIRALPTVIALKKGQPVSAFQNALPEAQIRTFLDKVVPSANEERIKKARALLDAGDAKAAQDDLMTALALEPTLDSARVLLAEIAFRDNQLDEAEAILAKVAPVNQMNDDFSRVQARIEAAREAAHLPGAADLQSKIDADPHDFDARMQLAVLYATQNQFEPAFQLLLDIVQKDRAWNEEAARKKLVEFFTLAQPEQPALVSRYRRALATALN
jgi:putative thioredoxin